MFKVNQLVYCSGDCSYQTMTNKNEQVELAKLAEQAERYSICLSYVQDGNMNYHLDTLI